MVKRTRSPVVLPNQGARFTGSNRHRGENVEHRRQTEA
jgi:hypothetical protein